MAIKQFQLGFNFKAIDRMSGLLKGVAAVDASVTGTARFREATTNLAIMGAKIAAPLKDAVAAFEKQQVHIARFGATLEHATDQTQLLGRAANFVRKKTAATGHDTGELSESLNPAFRDLSQAIAVTAAAAKVARATEGGVIETTNALTTALLNFGAAQKTASARAAMLADKLTALQTAGKWPKLGQSRDALKQASAAMNAMGSSRGLVALSTWSTAGLGTGATGPVPFAARTMQAFTQTAQSMGVLKTTIGGAPAPMVESATAALRQVTDLSPRLTAQQNISRAGTVFAVMGARIASVTVARARWNREITNWVEGWREHERARVFAALESISKTLIGWLTGGRWFQAGGILIKDIGAGLLSELHFLADPLGTVGKFIGAHFKRHSPPLGKPHQLNHVTLIGAIAETMRPAPMLAAVRRVAMVTAVAAPLIAGAGVQALAANRDGRRGGSAPIVINYQPRIVLTGGAGRADLEGVLRGHVRELYDLLQREKGRRDRSEFE